MGDTEDTIKLSAKFDSNNFDVTIPDSVWLRKGQSCDIKMKVQTKKGIEVGKVIILDAQSTGDPTLQSAKAVIFRPADYPFYLKLTFDPLSNIDIYAPDGIKIIESAPDWILYWDPKTRDVQTSAISYKITEKGLHLSRWYDWRFPSQCALFTTDFDVYIDGYNFSNNWPEPWITIIPGILELCGRCNGMAATSVLYFKKVLPLPENKNVYDLDRNKNLDENRDFTVADRIDRYQGAQDLVAMFQMLSELNPNLPKSYIEGIKKGEFEKLEKIIREEKEPALLGIEYPGDIIEHKLPAGHVLVVYKIIETDDAYYRLSLMQKWDTLVCERGVRNEQKIINI